MIYARAHGAGIWLGNRFFICLILSCIVLFFDQGLDQSSKIRTVFVDQALQPMSRALDFPSRFFFSIKALLITNQQLRADNKKNIQKLSEMHSLSHSYEQLQHRYQELERLTHYLKEKEITDKYLTVRISRIAFTDSREQVLLHVGASRGAVSGQVLIDELGLIGIVQTVHSTSSEALIITDPLSSVPARITRNGLIASVRGQGLTKDLAIDYLRADADIRVGDLLETSGLGGGFPVGIPIARVTSANNDSERKATLATAIPLARLEYHSPIILLTK